MHVLGELPEKKQPGQKHCSNLHHRRLGSHLIPNTLWPRRRSPIFNIFTHTHTHNIWLRWHARGSRSWTGRNTAPTSWVEGFESSSDELKYDTINCNHSHSSSDHFPWQEEHGRTSRATWSIHSLQSPSPRFYLLNMITWHDDNFN